jgi:DNA-binding NarL/FixJ family response regulator
MKILVVDDHPLIQEALTQLLPQLADDIDVRSAVTAEEATAILDDEPDVGLVLLDLALPDIRGLDLLADLMLDYPGVPVVVLSATHDRATVNAALAAGARGFIAKTSDVRELLDAVRLVCEGGEYLTSDITLAPDGDGVRIAPGALGLTTRQADVLMLLVQGKPNKLACFLE